MDFSKITLDELKREMGRRVSYRYGDKQPDETFCGLYFHGPERPFTLDEHDIPIRCFKALSRHSYPLFLFYNESSGGEIEEVLRRYDNIHVVPIQPILSIKDYDRFVIYQMFQWLDGRYNRTLTFHSDGFLLNSGWEDFVLEHDFDYIGAPWCGYCGANGHILLPHARGKYPINRLTAIGNGGFCFRKRDKCLEVVDRVNHADLNWAYNGFNLADDVFFSYFGFGLGIFRYYEESLAYRWAKEPIDSLDTYGFHRTQSLIDHIQSSNKKSGTA